MTTSIKAELKRSGWRLTRLPAVGLWGVALVTRGPYGVLLHFVYQQGVAGRASRGNDLY